MPQKQFLHELLKHDQEPFLLKDYIADRRSQLQKTPPPPPPPGLHLNKRRPSRGALCKHACFLSFQSSPDARKSPLFEFPSPIKSSPRNGAVYLHVPSGTAALLVEAAMRIQKQHRAAAQPRPKIVGLGLLGSFLKRLKDRSSRTKTIEKTNTTTSPEEKACRRRPSSSSANWTESNDASTTSYWSDGGDTRYCESPFRFNLLKSPPTSGRRTPEFCSPATSPCRRVNQEKENSKAIQEEEDKEQCSPVSILEAPFEDDDENENNVDYHLQCSYENVLRAKQQLLHRIRRFEELAELGTIELESDDEVEESEPILKRVLDSRSIIASTNDMKKLVSDLIVEEQKSRVGSCDDEVVTSRVCERLDSWGGVEMNTIDMMIGFDFKGEVEGWTRCNNVRAEDVSGEIEVAIYGLLVEELSDELILDMDTLRQSRC